VSTPPGPLDTVGAPLVGDACTCGWDLPEAVEVFGPDAVALDLPREPVFAFVCPRCSATIVKGYEREGGAVN
jgi:hypothetical protein